MRQSLVLAVVLSAVLSACAAAPNSSVREPGQNAPLKVHPGLLGRPAAPEIPSPVPIQTVPEAGGENPTSLKLDPSLSDSNRKRDK